MPGARIKSYVLSIQSSNSSQYDLVSVKNRTTGQTLRRINGKQIQLNSNKRALVDLANLPNGFSVGDVIEVKVIGTAKSGYTTHTIQSTNKGGGTITITSTANPKGGINL